MPPTSPDRIVLTDAQRGDLDRLVRAGRTEQRLALRAGIVLAAADGQSNARIAASLGVCQDTVRKWRHRWCAAPGVSSLGDAKRSGRPPVFTPVQVAQVKALACTPPGRPTCRCPAGRARNWPARPSAGGICESISAVHGAPLAVRGRAQTLAVPVVDLHHRPRLRGQGAAGAGPVRTDLGRETVGPERVRDLRRREDLHPGPLPLPPHPAARARPG